jgi:16S rRNA (guanine(966)-N(2))-methyltransferase RsmD
MRITGGEARGRIIHCPPGKEIRPTSSKMRQALFNILGPRVTEANFLDIFAGTGLMGLEALSRGAAALTAIEQNKVMADSIEANARNFGYTCRILPLDFKRAIPLLAGEQFDIVFADPPYKSGFANAIVREVADSNLLKEDGVLVVEHLRSHEIQVVTNELSLRQVRPYGQSAFSFFQKGLENLSD